MMSALILDNWLFYISLSLSLVLSESSKSNDLMAFPEFAFQIVNVDRFAKGGIWGY